MSVGFFLRNSVGFFIQIFTCTLLCFLPFPKEAFRYRRRWILTGYGILSILLSVCFPLGQYLPSIAEMPDKSLFANLYMLGAVVIFTVFYVFLIRDLAIKKLLVVNLAVFYAATQYMLVHLITPFFPDGNVPGIYPPQMFWAYVITSAVLFPLASWASSYRAQLSGRDRSGEHPSGAEGDRLRCCDIRRAGGIHKLLFCNPRL